MSTNHDVNLTAVFRCPDPRNALGLALGTLEPLKWGLLEFPSMAGTLPPGAAEEIERQNINRLIILVHGDLVTGEGCGARKALSVLKAGGTLDVASAKTLPGWLLENVDDGDSYLQSMYMSCKVGMTFPAAHILTAMFDQLTQTMYPIAMRKGETDWANIGREEWQMFRESPVEAAVPMLPVHELEAWMQRIVGINHAVSNYSSELAYASDYHHFIVRAIVVNTTPFAPDAFSQVRKILGITDDPETMVHPYYSVYCDPSSPEWWLPQLEYGLDHMQPGSRIIVLGQDKRTVDYIGGLIAEIPDYGSIVRRQNAVEYRLVVDRRS